MVTDDCEYGKIAFKKYLRISKVKQHTRSHPART